MEITAQDGKTKETVTVKVNTGSSDATLKALAISAGTLAPAFDAKTTAYTDAAPAGTTSVKVTPTVNAGNAKVTVDGKAVDSGKESDDIALDASKPTAIAVVVTAEDTATKETCACTSTLACARRHATDADVFRRSDTITATVDAPAPAPPPPPPGPDPDKDATLSALSVSEGTLTPAFDAGTKAYTVDEAEGTASITVTATLTEPDAKMTCQGADLASGTASPAIDLKEGAATTITLEVTAKDTTTKESYTIAASVSPTPEPYEG